MVRLGYTGNAGYWIYWNTIAELIRRRVDPSNWLRVSYEDFTAEPEAVLRQIVEKFQLPTEGWPLQGRVLRLGEHHTVEGNPSRFRTGSRPIVYDDQWLREMSSGARVLTAAITSPLFVAYGYHKRRPR
jgi:hypothetical protein